MLGLSCSDVGEPVCCHEQCIGGCMGPGNDQCYACRNVYFNRTCVESCPIGFYKVLLLVVTFRVDEPFKSNFK